MVSVGVVLAMRSTVTSDFSLDEITRVLDSANIIVHGFDGIVTRWTSGCEALYGWTRAEALGHVAHDLLETVFPQPLPDIAADLHTQGIWKGELTHRHKDGHPIFVASRWVVAKSECPARAISAAGESPAADAFVIGRNLPAMVDQ